ncbi:hypothetical protein [Devosia sp. 1566]|uniref:hypothetical protein n=1 Tax=Devosia sp. 1566 TaxID=2499144 RepID=UPI000FDA91E1|nr:hypothetical protein [Devosia sp. 1566]
MNQKLGRKKSLSRKVIMAGEERCVYCADPPDTLEHMPPKTMFKDRYRLSGMEFPCCEPCNNGTSAADLVAAFMSKIGPLIGKGDWELADNHRQAWMLRKKAPGFLEELFGPKANSEPILFKTDGGVLLDRVQIRTGPIGSACLDVFSAKLGMALYREHIGTNLPLTGAVNAMWFTNVGLGQDTADTLLSILPGLNALRQGKSDSLGQFAYRFNSDGVGMFSCLASFHKGLHVMLFAMADPELYDIPVVIETQRVTRPGGLLAMMPKPARPHNWNIPLLGTP